MTRLKYKEYAKGALLIIAGLLIAFFPGVISGLARIIGGIIIAFCIVSAILKLAVFKSGNIGINILGILIGAVVTFLPSVISVGIPVIAGIILGSAGAERGYCAWIAKNSGTKWIPDAVFSGILIVIAILMFMHPFQVTNIIKVLIGLAMTAVGIFYIVAERNRIHNAQPDIIDIDNYTVK